VSNIYPEDGSQAPGMRPEPAIEPVPATIKEQVGAARRRVKGEAAQFAATARQKAAGAVEQRQHQVTGAIGDFANAIRRASDDLTEHNQSMAAQIVSRAADSLEGVSRTIDGKSPGEMLNAVRDFGRRHPVAFIGGAALVGLAIGRFVRSSVPEPDYDETFNYEAGGGWDSEPLPDGASGADVTMSPEGATAPDDLDSGDAARRET